MLTWNSSAGDFELGRSVTCCRPSVDALRTELCVHQVSPLILYVKQVSKDIQALQTIIAHSSHAADPPCFGGAAAVLGLS
jgi:hypothetical protein